MKTPAEMSAAEIHERALENERQMLQMLIEKIAADTSSASMPDTAEA